MNSKLRLLMIAGPNGAGKTTIASRLIPDLPVLYERLVFLWVSSPEQAIERVCARVVLGGHHVPPEIIRRRYYAGLKNLLRHYLPVADFAVILDNSLPQDVSDRIIASKNVEYPLKVENKAVWKKIERVAAHG